MVDTLLTLHKEAGKHRAGEPFPVRKVTQGVSMALAKATGQQLLIPKAEPAEQAGLPICAAEAGAAARAASGAAVPTEAVSASRATAQQQPPPPQQQQHSMQQ